MSRRDIAVAAVQMDCQVGEVAANLAQAAYWVEQAAAQGARLVLLPELMPSGYQLDEALWESAEPMEGRTVQTLQALAQRCSVYVGTTFLEARDEDFYNTFVLVTPRGEIAGRVCKTPPASLEAYFYRSGHGESHVIETELGRIGVGICYENLLFRRLSDLYRAEVDLVLQPMAAGRLIPFVPGDVQRFDSLVRRGAPHYARVLGVPVVMANRAGTFDTPQAEGEPPIRSSFCGLSMIVARDGKVKASLGEDQGMIVAEVELGGGQRAAAPPKCIGTRWALRVPWYAFIWPMTQHPAERAYAGNERRKARARALSGQRSFS